LEQKDDAKISHDAMEKKEQGFQLECTYPHQWRVRRLQVPALTPEGRCTITVVKSVETLALERSKMEEFQRREQETEAVG
jgi:hypothetical protein